MPAATTEQRAERKQEEFSAHLERCPAEPDRLETFDAIRPGDRMILKVTRCRTCGGQSTKPTGRIAGAEPEENKR